MELEPIGYILADIGIDVASDEVNYAAQIMKKHLAVDACNIQDEHDFKASFAEHLNALGSDITGIVDISKRPDWNELYSTIVAKVAERADIRRVRAQGPSPSHYTWAERSSHEQSHHPDVDGAWGDFIAESGNPYGLTEEGFLRAIRNASSQWPTRSDMTRGLKISEETAIFWEARAGMHRRFHHAPLKPIAPSPSPSHYTDETPEGALEAMERRLSGGFSQQMSEALAQMELKVGELAEAISRMGTSVPAPIVEAAEAVEEAVEVVEAVATGRRPRSESKAQAIRDHIISLGARADQENVSTVVAALQSSFPDITERDVTNAIRTLPGGSTLGRKPTVRRQDTLPDIEPEEAAVIPPSIRRSPGFSGSPRTQAIRAYALEQGQGLANISSSDIVIALRGQFPEINSQHVLEAISLEWRTALGAPALKAAIRRGGPTGPRGTSMLDFIAREPRPERREVSPYGDWEFFVLRSFGETDKGRKQLAGFTYRQLYNQIKEGIIPELTADITIEEVRERISPDWLELHGLPQLRG